MCHRTFIYSWLMRGRPFPAFLLFKAFVFCTGNGLLQSYYLIYCAEYPDAWYMDLRFSLGKWSLHISFSLPSQHSFPWSKSPPPSPLLQLLLLPLLPISHLAGSPRGCLWIEHVMSHLKMLQSFLWLYRADTHYFLLPVKPMCSWPFYPNLICCLPAPAGQEPDKFQSQNCFLCLGCCALSLPASILSGLPQQPP